MEAIISPSNRVVDRGPSKHVDRLGFDIWHRVFLARFGGIRSDAAAAAAAMFWRAWMRAAVRQKVILAAVNYMLNQTWCSTSFFDSAKMATKINITPGRCDDADQFGAGYFLRSLIVSLSAAKTWVIFATGCWRLSSACCLPHSEKSGTKSRDT